MLDPELSAAFSLYANPKAFALLLGSGVSRAAMIPTGWEITLDLVRKIGRLQGAPEQADWAAWHQETFGEPPNYSKLLDQLSQGPDERRAIVHSYIEPTEADRQEGRRTATAAHRAIARLVADGFIRVIITTNFDRLLEEALREVGVEPTVIASDDAILGATPLIHCQCCIIKVHGDYLDTRIRNTDEELAGYSGPMNALLDRILDDHGLIVCGWSSDWDPALRAAIQRTPNRRYPLFWVSKGEPTALAADVIAGRGGKVVSADGADGFFSRLSERVALQRELQQPDPRSNALLVATAKKYVARPEHRVQLHDLLGQEAKRLLDVLPPADDVPNVQGAPDFNRWVGRVESAVEPLAKLMIVLGRWGGDGELDLALRLIRARLEMPTVSGFTNQIALREYPAILLASAFGLGAIAADRTAAVYRLYKQEVRSNGQAPQAFVREHFLDRWSGGQRDEWNLLAERQTQPLRVPLSQHLHTLLGRWSADVLLDASEFEEAFARFELIGSLLYMLEDAKIEELKLARASRTKGDWIWTPLGRTAFEDRRWEPVLNRWGHRDAHKELKLLAGGDEELATLAVEHLRQQISGRRFFD